MGDSTDIRTHVKAILAGIGEDPTREGLEKTPERVEKALQFLTQGYAQDAGKPYDYPVGTTALALSVRGSSCARSWSFANRSRRSRRSSQARRSN
jgi:hypothetical protein